MEMHINYKLQQRAINEICEELGLIAFRPNYHADKKDKNTVIIYTKTAHEHNKQLPPWAGNSQYMPSVCHFENSDSNNQFSFDFMNGGKIDCRGNNMKENIRTFIKSKLQGKS